jgi:hypothetical protein
MPRNDFNSPREVFSDIAQRKADAAHARQAGADPAAEPSAQVYAESCARIAAAFAAEGFRYAKSGPHLTRKAGIFSHQISFHSSYHNIPGRHVSLSAAARVRAKKLEEWRKLQPRSWRSDDWLAGGMIHLLGTDRAYITWELADASSRPATTADIVACLGGVVLPYFARFEEPARLIAELERAHVPACQLPDAVELALCFSGPASAKKIIRRFVDSRPDLAESIREAETRVAREGAKRHPAGYAEEVAFLRFTYGLG